MGKKVLVVDDSSTIRQQVAQTLAESDFSVIEAVDGKHGIEMITKNPDIALVIIDINMPNMNGLEMLEALKADGKNATLPVIMLTTEVDGRLVERAKKGGAAGWLVKPYKPPQLLAVVTKLAR